MHSYAKTAVSLGIATAGRLIAPFQTARRREHNLRYPLTREAFIALVPKGPALEIGPFDNPVLTGDRIAYFDVLDQQHLRLRSVEHKRNPGGTPTIDFVSPIGDLSIIDRTFGSVLSSHVIEHQPDLIDHLRNVEHLLDPGGCYFLMVPDRRYSFDHFIKESALADIELAHQNGERLHSVSSITEHYLSTTHNRALKHWLGFHGGPSASRLIQEACERACEDARQGVYVDVHAWIFTPEGFGNLIRALIEKGHIGLRVKDIFDTAFGRLEFYAVLQKPHDVGL